MVEMVVFDMAGTTVDEQNLVYKTLHKAMERANYQIPFEQVLIAAAGKEKLQAIKDSLSQVDVKKERIEEVAQEVYQDFRESLMNAYHTEPVQSQPNAETVFRKLNESGIKVVLNTGYDRNIADLLLKKLKWDDLKYIDLTVTASEVEYGRPNPDMIIHAMDRLNCQSAKSVIKIGDSIVDIEEGQRAGCLYSIGITTGAHTRKQLLSANPDAVIDRLEEVLQLVNY